MGAKWEKSAPNTPVNRDDKELTVDQLPGRATEQLERSPQLDPLTTEERANREVEFLADQMRFADDSNFDDAPDSQ